MRAKKLFEFSESNGEWLFGVVDGASEEEHLQHPPIRVFPPIESAYHLIPEHHEMLLSTEQTLGNVAFCGDFHSLAKHLDRISDSRRETDKSLHIGNRQKI
jgi:hypothetical protein